ncbi:RagB/SusD family nutrient uptake outer membrane protein [Pedobacter sp. SAFR-022]|uniref:RagB/SusD family nutrient uptake outer membrane protein n=1 Tax=Pedobacter sp. SAFR-022 TaxID=3436861 RepID=UPI003F7D45C2
MKKILVMILMVIGVTVSPSCKKYLDQVPDDRLTMDDIFTSKKYVDEYLASIYSNIPNELMQRYINSDHSGPWIASSDEAMYNWDFNYSRNMNQSTWASTDGPVSDFWTDYYKSIRSATDFIDKIDAANPVEVNDALKTRYKAEAKALRALYYFWLIRMYGPVPLINKVTSPDAPLSDLLVERNTFEECVNFVVTELDAAYADLPLQPINDEYGRMTKGIVKAYKEQALLLAASPLFNGNTDMASLVNKAGIPLISQTYEPNKWKLAADAAKAFIDEFVPSTYDLYSVQNGDPFIAAYLSCRDISLLNWNKEWIFGRSNSGVYSWHDKTPLHKGYTTEVQGFGALGATQKMVDAYFMGNGLAIDVPGSGYQQAGFVEFKAPFDIKARSTFAQWANREPRFYVGITYNNSYWLYQGSNNREVVTNMEFSGNSGRSQSSSDISPTGYTVRKDVTNNANSRGSMLLRLGQIYLDYAEALNEYEPGNPNILTYLNLIRKRAGVPAYGNASGQIPVSTDQSIMRSIIRRERQVELSFESVRYFDCHRWKIAMETDNEPVRGMNMYADGSAFYQLTTVADRTFRQRDYLWPIPNDEILKNSLLVQNPGW